MYRHSFVLILSIAATMFACSMTGTSNPEALPLSTSPIYVSEYRIADGWLEIHNPSDSTVSIGKYRLFIDHKYQDFDKRDLAPDEYRLIAKLEPLKEASLFYLLDNEGKLVDLIDEPIKKKRKSIVRTPDGQGGFTVKEEERLTPGYPNDAEGSRAYQASRRKPNTLGVVFSEIVATGKEEFVELHNTSHRTIDLSGYGLSDKENYVEYAFPEGSVLGVDEYLAVLCKENSADSTYAPFSIKNAEESLYLTDPDNNVILEYGPVSMPKKHGLVSVNGAPFIASDIHSPGKPNELPGTAPAASVASGHYNGIDTLKVELYAQGDIRYTTDGSAPDKSSKKYSEPFKFTKTSIIRAVAIAEDGSASPVSSYTYLINENHKLDVVSMMSEPKGLFSTGSGIYANGPYRLKPQGTEDDGKPGIVYPYVQANYWRRWWRAANVSLLPLEGEGFSYDCGASIFGGFSRIHPKKSLKFKFSKKYGPKKLNYKLFENRDTSVYNNFIVRTGGQDAFGSIIRDDLISHLADTVLDVMASRPVIYYINGKYYGIYFLREKINEHFVAAHYKVPTDSVDLVTSYYTVENGSANSLISLISYVKRNNMAKDECYEHVARRMDVQNFADWVIAEIWNGNKDAGNVRCFRSPYIDNKWRWILYDTDMGMVSPYSDAFLVYVKPGVEDFHQTDLIRGLMKNKQFRELFIERFEFQMKHVWNKERVHAAIDYFSDAIDPEVERNNKRWYGSYKGWQSKIEGLHRFADERQAHLRSQFASNPLLRSIFHMSTEELNRCFGENKPYTETEKEKK